MSDALTQLPFRDRADAGRQLAPLLAHYRGAPGLIVLALPRGGAPVAAEVAAALDAPLDVMIVRKVGVPGHEELAMGAIASGGARVRNDQVLTRLGLDETTFDAAVGSEVQELERRERLYRGDRPPLDVTDRTVILVDDGLATGSTMLAAVQALHQQNPRQIVVAVPVAPPDTCAQFEPHVDEIICGATPPAFGGVGRWYESFAQTTDDEVRDALQGAWSHQ